MRKRFRPWSGALALSAIALAGIFAVAAAAERPEVTRVDARHLDRGAVVFQIEWQSPNPVSVVRAFFGKYKKEVKVDEYDNRRNKSGYAGEATVEFALPPGVYPAGVPYIVQIEDDTRRKSDQVAGKVTLPQTAKRREPDAFGKGLLDQAAAGTVPKPPVGVGTPQTQAGEGSQVDTTGQTGIGPQDPSFPAGAPDGSLVNLPAEQQAPEGMYQSSSDLPQAGQYETYPGSAYQDPGAAQVSVPGQPPPYEQQIPQNPPQAGQYEAYPESAYQDPGTAQVSVPGQPPPYEQQSSQGIPPQYGGIQQGGYADAPQGYPGESRSGPSIESFQPRQVQTGETVISFQVREERGVREIGFTVYDANNNIVAHPVVQNTMPGPFWQGECPPFALPGGRYRVLAQAYALDGTFSQKEIGDYDVALIGRDASVPSPQAGASPPSGAAGMSLPKITFTSPDSIVKKIPGGGTVQFSKLPTLSLGGSGNVLHNDSYGPGGAIHPIPELRGGDEVAVVLGPVNAPVRVTKIAFLCARSSEGGMADLAIYLEPGGGTPGRQIYAAGIQATCAAGQLREIDLSAARLTVPGGSVRVLLRIRANGIPPLAHDADGVSQSGRNWFGRAGRWTDFLQAGFPGDAVIRAVVEDR